MKISVIIPVYNGEKYIKRAIESVINQEYKKLEIIIINDGSKDKTLNIIKEFRDTRIKVIDKKNTGVSNSRNIGVDASTGDYIMFLDADDYIDKNYIEEINNDIDIVITNYKEEYKDKTLNINCFDSMKYGINKINNLDIESIICSNGGYVWGKFFKKSIIDKYNIRFNENYSMCEDLLFTLSFMTKASYALKKNKYGYTYFRINENSITSKLKETDIRNQIFIQSEIEEIIKFRMDNKDINKLLSGRFKNIFMFIIYKIVVVKEDTIKNKLNKIEDLFEYKYISDIVNEFDGEGIVDKMLVKAMKNRNIKKIYLYTVVRKMIIKIIPG